MVRNIFDNDIAKVSIFFEIHKNRHCLSAMSLFGLLTKKDIAFRRCLCSVFSQRKTLPFGDVSFWGARTDSNRRHSEPQAELRMSHKPCIHRYFRNFRFFVCGYFAAIYARTDSFSINLLRFEMNHS